MGVAYTEWVGDGVGGFVVTGWAAWSLYVGRVCMDVRREVG